MKKIVFLLLFSFMNSASSTVFTERPAGFTPIVEVSACFIEKDGKVLFLHRQDGKSHANKWAIPGGKVDKNENALQAILREVNEETGITLHKENISFIKTVYISHSKTNGVSFIYHMYRAPYDGPFAITLSPSEHKGFTWVTISDALKMDLMEDEAPCINIAYQESKQ